MKKSSNSIKQGDIYKIGEHIVACGDCQDKEFMAKVLKGRTINAVISDVPYGVAVTESKRGFSKLKKDKVILNDHLQSDAEYMAFTLGWITALKPYLARKNAFYVFNADKMIFALREGMLQAGCKFAQLLIWVKTHAVIGRMDYAPQHELIAYGWLGVHEFMKSKDKSVIIYPKPNKSPLHPSTKPVGLIRHLVLNSTKINDTVIDPFLGSGTAVVACEETKRKCIGVEIEPEYCQTTLDRMESLFGLKAQKL
jgi:DNA modification methylase